MKAEFIKKGNTFYGFSVKGHADLAPEGEDILCAAVSSAVQMTANGITEILKLPAQLTAFEDEITLVLPQKNAEAGNMIASLWLQMTLLAEEYEDYIEILVKEE